MVTCGYNEILLHDLGEEDLPFVSISELDYLRRTWLRAVFAFIRNGLDAPSQDNAHIVVNIFRWIWASTLLFTT